ncbi:MAG: glucokinase [Desulfuromonadaceae bacterium]|nr:glucokinase [Desulfuromonadaceae bacterium]
MLLLGGDVGGTTSRFQFKDTEDETRFGEKITYPSGAFPSFYALLQHLLQQHNIAHVDGACFGLPGPITDKQVELTNLPWHICVDEIKRQHPIAQVELINDFYAAALGVDLLTAADYVCVYEGEYDPNGNRLVIGAGTGLGVAPVYQIGGCFYPQPSEGGHINFAPLNQEQEILLRWLHSHWDRISYENILSGSGLETLYRFCTEQKHPAHPRAPAGATHVSAPEVHRLALAGDYAAREAVRLFVNIYGAFVGNAALIWPARAGIYLAGGIGAKLVDWMTSAEFVSFFLNKGTMRALVEKMPVYLVMDDMMGLKGAMLKAQRLI